MRCRVKAGKQLPHDGTILPEGTDVELPPHIAAEVPHLVDEVLATGATRAIGAPGADALLRSELERAKPHERISILQAARSSAVADLMAIDQQIAAEQKRLEAEQKKVTPAAASASTGKSDKA